MKISNTRATITLRTLCAVLSLMLVIVLFPSSMIAKAQTLDPRQLQTDDVKRSLSSDKYEIRLVGENEVAVVIQESNIAVSKGSVIMLSDAGQTQLGSRSLAPVATLLNQYGWTTLLAAPPMIGNSGGGSNTADANAQGDASTKETLPNQGQQVISQSDFDSHQQQLQLLMQSLVEKSNEYPGFVVVLAQGTTAAWLAKMYNEQLLTEPDALVSVSAFWPQMDLNSQIAGFFASANMPVLDLYNQWDNKWTLSTAERRKIEAAKALKLHYRQTELIGVPLGQGQHQYMTKQIIGWLSYMGW